jgi:hypothetical protein
MPETGVDFSEGRGGFKDPIEASRSTINILHPVLRKLGSSKCQQIILRRGGDKGANILKHALQINPGKI